MRQRYKRIFEAIHDHGKLTKEEEAFLAGISKVTAKELAAGCFIPLYNASDEDLAMAKKITAKYPKSMIINLMQGDERL